MIPFLSKTGSVRTQLSGVLNGNYTNFITSCKRNRTVAAVEIMRANDAGRNLIVILKAADRFIIQTGKKG
ncbi:MAG: hypothetical protein ACLRQF_03065 [Thomasclavelia ramosa]